MQTTGISRILLGITGGIAAYKAAELTRLLIKNHITVQVAMTHAAQRLITPLTFQALTGEPVLSNLWDNPAQDGMAHIHSTRQVDLILVAPATANFLSKLAHGVANDMLSSLCLARNCPLWVAPAMNVQMWEHPATQRNVTQIQQDGVHVLAPSEGMQACGETGIGRMLEPDQILQRLISSMAQPFRHKKILITAGATFEPVDAVRGITNMSSGRMGFAIAQAAERMGAEVTLVYGKTQSPPPVGITAISATTAQEMLNQVMSQINDTDIFIAAAAISDYYLPNPRPDKIKKNGENLILELYPTVDVLSCVAQLPNPPFCVGFSAESDQLIAHAEEKRRRKQIPLIAANLLQESLNQEDCTLTLIDDQGQHPLPRGNKAVVAQQLLQHIACLMNIPDK